MEEFMNKKLSILLLLVVISFSTINANFGDFIALNACLGNFVSLFKKPRILIGSAIGITAFFVGKHLLRSKPQARVRQPIIRQANLNDHRFNFIIFRNEKTGRINVQAEEQTQPGWFTITHYKLENGNLSQISLYDRSLITKRNVIQTKTGADSLEMVQTALRRQVEQQYI